MFEIKNDNVCEDMTHNKEKKIIKADSCVAQVLEPADRNF